MNWKKLLLGATVLMLSLHPGGLFAETSHYSDSSGVTRHFSKNATPPNEMAIVQKLKESGAISKNATPQEIKEALNAYLQKKLVDKTVSETEDKALLVNSINETIQINNLTQPSASGKSLNFGKLIRSTNRSAILSDEDEDDSNGNKKKDEKKNGWEKKGEPSDIVYKTEVKKVKLLVLLADFADDEYGKGPLFNKIEKPTQKDNSTLWVDNFDANHYRKMLFTKGGYDTIDQNGKTMHLDSMVDYYWEQSRGSYLVEGDVFGWFTLPHSEAYYGDDDPEGGHDNKLPGTSKDLVKDLLVVAKSQNVPFEDFDIEDPYDIDKDGNLDEADGIIDHLVIVHAGIDQSGGGGAQGDDAIWAHSSSVWSLIPSDNPTAPYWDGNMVAYRYVIQGENGSLGVFCHEFGHDIGLPDEYDTKYSGQGDPVAFYSLMSSGSWTGKPLGTKPAPFSPWGRAKLGELHGGNWTQPTNVDIETLKKDDKKYVLDQTTEFQGKNHQIIKVNLPKHKLQLTAPYEGLFEYYSGKGDEQDYTMRTTVSLPDAKEINLSYWTAFNIEEDWDFGFIQISTDGGETFKSLSTPYTTDTIVPDGYPAIIPNMPGYTGKSNGWINESIDLSSYAGQTVVLQFRYMTDWGTTEEGFYVDQIEITADNQVIFSDNAESGSQLWALTGWTLFEGFEWKDHYYLLEWRTLNNIDESQKYCYSWADSADGIVQYYQNEPGLLVWYRDTAITDNWVGIHPGEVFLGVVDSHPDPILDAASEALRTRFQLHDASFSFLPIFSKTFYSDGQPVVSPRERPVHRFSDSNTYWYPEAPSAGIKLTKYGLKIRVVDAAKAFSKGLIKLSID